MSERYGARHANLVCGSSRGQLSRFTLVFYEYAELEMVIHWELPWVVLLANMPISVDQPLVQCKSSTRILEGK